MLGGTARTFRSNPYKVTNASAEVFACEIFESEAEPGSHTGLHARGDCETPEGFKGFFITVAGTV
jgi:hypothetical protein